MAESYWPFDAGAGASSTESRWRAMAQHWVHGGSGVLATELNKLSTIGDSTGMQVKVDTGRAWVRGHFYENDAQKTVAILANASGNPRIDRVVVRADFTANTIGVVVITGTPAASPVAPAITQTSTVFDVPLAQVAVANGAVTIAAGNVTDERVLIGPNLLAAKAPSTTALDLLLGSPVAGMLRDVVATEMIARYSGSAWVPLLPYGDAAVQTWTPQVDQGGSTNIAKTVNAARYVELGALVLFDFDLSMTAAGTGSNAVSVTLPHTPIGTSNAILGPCRAFDASASAEGAGVLTLSNGTNKVFFVIGASVGIATLGASSTAAISNNIALASGDQLRGSGFYYKAA